MRSLSPATKLSLLAGLGWLALACGTIDDPCSPGQTHKNGFCVEPGTSSTAGGNAGSAGGGDGGASGGAADGGSANGSAGAGETAGAAGAEASDTSAGGTGSGGGSTNGRGGGGGGSGGSEVVSGQLGDYCESAADCSAAADYCAIQPGNSSGYCTPTGCDEDPSLCPAPFHCEDRFVAFGAPAFCAE